MKNKLQTLELWMVNIYVYICLNNHTCIYRDDHPKWTITQDQNIPREPNPVSSKSILRYQFINYIYIQYVCVDFSPRIPECKEILSVSDISCWSSIQVFNHSIILYDEYNWKLVPKTLIISYSHDWNKYKSLISRQEDELVLKNVLF